MGGTTCSTTAARSKPPPEEGKHCGRSELEAPRAYLSTGIPSPSCPRRPVPSPPPPGWGLREGGGPRGLVSAGRAHHATRDVPWREAAPGASVVHSAPGAG